MAKTIRTTTATSTIGIPYQFVCQSCGKRNFQIAKLVGIASETRTSSYQHASGTLGVEAQKQMIEAVRKTDDELRTYADRLRKARGSDGSDIQALRETDFSFLYPFFGTVCAYCGKKQNWTGSSPKNEGKEKKSHKGCLIPIGGLVLAITLFAVATVFSGTAAADIIGAAGFLILLAGIIIFLVNLLRSLEKDQTVLVPESVDPDTLPVLDLQDLENPDRIPSEDKLAVPAKITIIRESAFYLNGVTDSFSLNGRDVGDLANGESLDTETHRQHNVLYVLNGSFEPLVFEVESGAQAEIHFRASRFVPDACSGIRIISYNR